MKQLEKIKLTLLPPEWSRIFAYERTFYSNLRLICGIIIKIYGKYKQITMHYKGNIGTMNLCDIFYKRQTNVLVFL